VEKNETVDSEVADDVVEEDNVAEVQGLADITTHSDVVDPLQLANASEQIPSQAEASAAPRPPISPDKRITGMFRIFTPTPSPGKPLDILLGNRAI
jgi:hypothetical protein